MNTNSVSLSSPVNAGSPGLASPSKTPLHNYSLRDNDGVLSDNFQDSVPLVGNVIVTGQASVIYAAPNTGKTLLTLRLIADSVKAERIKPDDVFYINVDDNLSGLQEKMDFINGYGFHMLADGYMGFKTSKLESVLDTMIADGSAKGRVIVLDTLKRFVDLMSKSDSSGFAKWLRAFTLKGGTVVALAHTNKNPDSSGKAQYSGTSDMVADLDCAVMLESLSSDRPDEVRYVEFRNFKSRGRVQDSAVYEISAIKNNTYRELIDSVREVSGDELSKLKRESEIKSDLDIIEVIKAAIDSGVSDKTRLIKEARMSAGVSRAKVISVLDKYTGKVFGEHFWSVTKGARTLQTYELVSNPSQAYDPDDDF